MVMLNLAVDMDHLDKNRFKRLPVPEYVKRERIAEGWELLKIREAAAVVEQCGEQAYAEFRQKGSRWFCDDTYFFVWTMDATRVFHAVDPDLEGRNERDLQDIRGRPFGRMFLDAGGSPSGEGWVHYMYPEPGSIFPMWKSSFIKRVTFPSGKRYIIGCGIYNLQMDKAFIEDLVNRAAALVAERGRGAFGQLRDRTGPFLR